MRYALLVAFGATAVQASSLRSEIEQKLGGGPIDLSGQCQQAGLVYMGDPGARSAGDSAGWPGQKGDNCGQMGLSIWEDTCLFTTGMQNSNWAAIKGDNCRTGNVRACLDNKGYSAMGSENFNKGANSECIIGDACAGKAFIGSLSLGSERVQVCCSNDVAIGRPDSFSHFGVDKAGGASHGVECDGQQCHYTVTCSCPVAKGNGVENVDPENGGKWTTQTFTSNCDGAVADSNANIVISPTCNGGKVHIGSAYLGSPGAKSGTKQPSDAAPYPFAGLQLKPSSDGTCEVSIGEVYIGNPGKQYE